ncbi:MAG: 50S ribosomal protein L29 [Patescibacteria group bacterium]|nr:50S ribosomal protein L29 [Patescibacteria group bacterium]
MKVKDIVAKKDQDLVKKLSDLEEELVKLRFQIATKESDKSASIVSTKKDIARIKTILREREIGREEEVDEKKA